MREFDGYCPVCGGEVSCMCGFEEYEEYECDECGATFVVTRVVTEIHKREEQE